MSHAPNGRSRAKGSSFYLAARKTLDGSARALDQAPERDSLLATPYCRRHLQQLCVCQLPAASRGPVRLCLALPGDLSLVKWSLGSHFVMAPPSASSAIPAGAGDRILPHALMMSGAEAERVQQYYALLDGLSTTLSFLCRNFARSWHSVMRWPPESNLLTLDAA